jgi:hypothetical protein
MMIRCPKYFNLAIQKYDYCSDPSIWLKMYNIAARASGGKEDHLAGYFPLVMGKAPLMWLDIAYYNKGVTNLKLFEKIHEADANTIAGLMAYVDKLVDTQDAVVHNFKGEDHDDGDGMLRKQSGEVYVADPPRTSTFLEGDFNCTLDNVYQFHRDTKHTMRECEQLKRALGIPQEPKKTKSGNNND